MRWLICNEGINIWTASWQNQQNGNCAQRRLRSAWASAQSDQSLRCPHEQSLGSYLTIERTAKALVRLGGYPGWSESWLGAHVILLVLSWDGSFIVIIVDDNGVYQFYQFCHQIVRAKILLCRLKHRQKLLLNIIYAFTLKFITM